MTGEGPRLEETERGTTVYAGGRYLYSRRDPSAVPRRVASGFPLEEKTLYVIPSPLLGYGIAEILARLPVTSRILALEADQSLMAVTSPSIPREILSHPKITWIRADEPAALHAVVEKMGLWRFRRLVRIDLTGGATLHEALYHRLLAFLEEDIATYWRNRHTIFSLGRTWIRRLLANIALNNGALPVQSLSVNGTVVVAGAGESLEAALPLLKKRRKEIWLLATDTALPVLLGADLRPDAVVALETQCWNLLDFHDSRGTSIPVIGDLTSYPGGLAATGGNRFLFATSFAPCRLLDRLEAAGLSPRRYPPMGSVGLVAVAIAMDLGEGDVLLTGLDFSYRPGKTHARGSSPHRWLLAGTDRLHRGHDWAATLARPPESIPGTGGELVRSDSVLAGYAAGLRAALAGDRRVSVIAPGGADLGVALRHPREVDSQLERASVPEVFISGGSADSNLAGDFLDREEAVLNRVIEAWEIYSETGGKAVELLDALREADHVTIDFPDEPPLPKEDTAFLTRAVSRTRSLLAYIRRIRNHRRRFGEP